MNQNTLIYPLIASKHSFKSDLGLFKKMPPPRNQMYPSRNHEIFSNCSKVLRNILEACWNTNLIIFDFWLKMSPPRNLVIHPYFFSSVSITVKLSGSLSPTRSSNYGKNDTSLVKTRTPKTTSTIRWYKKEDTLGLYWPWTTEFSTKMAV